jgi:hypothetical protein
VRERVTFRPLRELNRRHLADELQHARVGWAMLSTLPERDRALLREWLPVLLRLVRTACCEGPEREYDELVPFGYFTPSLLHASYDRAVEEVILPGFRHLGIQEAA